MRRRAAHQMLIESEGWSLKGCRTDDKLHMRCLKERVKVGKRTRIIRMKFDYDRTRISKIIED